jgi:hypothetical protein
MLKNPRLELCANNPEYVDISVVKPELEVKIQWIKRPGIHIHRSEA